MMKLICGASSAWITCITHRVIHSYWRCFFSAALVAVLLQRMTLGGLALKLRNSEATHVCISLGGASSALRVNPVRFSAKDNIELCMTRTHHGGM